MRKPFLAGNMKMFKTHKEANALAEGLKKELSSVKDREILICPPYTSLHVIREVFAGTHMQVGAQDVYWEKEGAYTGEVSAGMLADAGCSYIIIGHSERRQYFGETDESVNRKIKATQGAGIRPIVCVGETLAQREAGTTFNVLEKQLATGLREISIQDPEAFVIAYEPVWAIGTGKTATPQQAQEVHAFIRKKLVSLFDGLLAQQIRILYGGSIKPENIKRLMEQPDIDGGLVGGACLKVEHFTKIVRY